MTTSADAAIEIRKGNFIAASTIYEGLAAQSKLKRRSDQANHYRKLAEDSRIQHEKLSLNTGVKISE